MVFGVGEIASNNSLHRAAFWMYTVLVLNVTVFLPTLFSILVHHGSITINGMLISMAVPFESRI